VAADVPAAAGVRSSDAEDATAKALIGAAATIHDGGYWRSV
jgi:hypothetical protein